MKIKYSITQKQHQYLFDHLFPRDGNEAVSIILCGRHYYKGTERLFTHKIFNIPYEKCSKRGPGIIEWDFDLLVPFLDIAVKEKMAILKIHSHPEGYSGFSFIDDNSDKKLFPVIYNWVNDYLSPHASLIMLPDGNIIGRIVKDNGSFGPIDQIKLVGDNIKFWFPENDFLKNKEIYQNRIEIAFGKDTIKILSKLKIGIVGCSGTGSPTIEQLARLGVGRLVLVDPDVIKKENLNRIYNSKHIDAMDEEFKINRMKKSIIETGLGTKVEVFKENIFNKEVISSIADCDIIFGCVDTVVGRHILNRISNYYLIPYFDIGSKIVVNKNMEIEYAGGSINYLQPGLSTLLSRGIYTMNQFESEMLHLTNPQEYEERKKENYIHGIGNEPSPSVISINTSVSSLAVNDFLSRIHKIRNDSNEKFAITNLNLCENELLTESENDQNRNNIFIKGLGKGTIYPLLDMPYFSLFSNLLY